LSIYDYSATTIAGDERSLSVYRGQVLLIVNVASQCGFTPQYAGLEALYRKFHERGFAVLGFPCDQFGHQEPGDETQIQTFCSINYGVTFPMFAKIKVNGADAHPLYQYLRRARRGLFGLQTIKWNFTKFLVDSRGEPVRRFGSAQRPDALEGEISAQLLEARDTGH